MKRQLAGILLALMGAAIAGCQQSAPSPESIALKFAEDFSQGGGKDQYCYKPDYDLVRQRFSFSPGDAISVVGEAEPMDPAAGFPSGTEVVEVLIGDDRIKLAVAIKTADYKKLAFEMSKALKVEVPRDEDFTDQSTCVRVLPKRN